MNKIVETFEGIWMYNPILGNVFVVDEDGKDYVILQRRRMGKDTIFDSKEAYQEYIEGDLKFKRKSL